MTRKRDINKPFNTLAENNADVARNLSNFGKLSLIDIRKNIEAILGLIGKTKEIFTTYTLHDIKHVDFMLDMLDWLIPDKTKEKMTSVDWLLIVLSIYFHDLGMFVSKDEYEGRVENTDFKNFVNNLHTDPKYSEYLSRIENIQERERDSFLYQEYVRKNHAIRVKQWILGTPPYYYGESVKKIVNLVQELLSGLPKRFLSNLADVCLSHDEDYISDTKLFPLCERYGNDKFEYANVQFAAIILRTVDLIHITKDRTPPAMFKLINISDSKGMEAWKTHMETSSVYMKHNCLSIEDLDSHIIQVKADFSDEYPFFPLTEYISWADDQIKQTKRLADISIKVPAAENYWFPWHTIESDVRVEGNSPFPLKFELDRGKLLDLLVGHTIYNDPLVAIRELIQNAIDAVRYQYYLDKKEQSKGYPSSPMGKICVKWKTSARELTIEDTGIGMDDDVIKHHLMRVGSSFYSTPDFQSKYSDFSPISRFGIGVLTCFMISDDIEVETIKNHIGHRIKMRSVHANYLLKELDIGAPELKGLDNHGTRIKLKIRSSIDFEKKSVYEILKHWVILPECDITYIEDDNPPKVIGFKSVSEALKHFYESEFSSKSIFDDSNKEVITFSDNSNGKEFELAFAVKTGYYPEKVFLKTYGAKTNTPAVCIEGIRVSNELPGFRNYSSEKICALLSIRGNSKLKTTVSRSGLEYDEEYNELEKRFVKMLVKHIHNEIERLSNNNSLSLASSAGYFIYNSIIRNSPQPSVVEYLEKQFEYLPLVVIEQTEKIDKEFITQRKLLPLSQLKEMESFWTLESRLADNLGVISRDLGKELSYNNFLIKNSPLLFVPEINPIVFDIFEIKEKVILSHTIEKVKFSKENQQTLVKWVKNNNSVDIKLIEIFNDDRLKKARIELHNKYRNLTRYTDKLPLINIILGTKIANIEGDLSDVIGVNTRVVKIYKSGSYIANIWEELKNAIIILYDKERFDELTLIISTSSIYSQIYDNGFNSRKLFEYSFETPGDENILSDWQEIANNANSVLTDLAKQFQFPVNMIDISSKKDKWFNAKQYWRDWFNIKNA